MGSVLKIASRKWYLFRYERLGDRRAVPADRFAFVLDRH